jgi:hypothetical protein
VVSNCEIVPEDERASESCLHSEINGTCLAPFGRNIAIIGCHRFPAAPARNP